MRLCVAVDPPTAEIAESVPVLRFEDTPSFWSQLEERAAHHDVLLWGDHPGVAEVLDRRCVRRIRDVRTLLTRSPVTVGTLHWVNGSIPSWTAQLVLYERGLRFHPQRLRVMGKLRETRTPAFLALNPRGQAPVLTLHLEDAPLTESMAIVHAVAARWPRPEDADPTVLTRMYEVSYLRAAYRPLEQLFLGPPDGPNRHRVAEAPERVAEELARWERPLADHPWVAGDAFTLADCVLYPALAYQVRRGLDLSPWPRLEAYLDAAHARDAVRCAEPIGWHRAPRRDLFAGAATL